MRRLLGTPRQWAVAVPGICMLFLGVALVITAGAEVPFGAGSWQAFETGMQTTFGVPFAVVVVGESLLVLVVSWGVLRVRPGPATLLLALVGGPSIEALLGVVPVPGTWPGATATFLLGAAVVALGLGLYIGADLGASAQDMLFVGLYTRLPMSPAAARFTIDLVLSVVGLLLAGQVGVGTVLTLVVVPPIVDRSLPLGRRLAGIPPEPDAATPAAAATPGHTAGPPPGASA